MSDSVRPHRRQPTRLPRPWDSPGKNAGVGCHFLLQSMKVKSESEVSLSCPTLSNLPGSSVHGIFQARVLEWVAIAFSDVTLRTAKMTSKEYKEDIQDSTLAGLENVRGKGEGTLCDFGCLIRPPLPILPVWIAS